MTELSNDKVLRKLFFPKMNGLLYKTLKYKDFITIV